MPRPSPRVFRLFLATLATFCPVSAFAQTTQPAPESPTYGPWRSSRIGGGGYVQHVIQAASDPQRVYTYVDMAGAYRSDDAGQSWRMIHAGLPATNGGYDVRGLSVDPRNADDLLLAVGNHRDHAYGVFHSTDGGATYTLVCNAIFSGNGTDQRAAGQVIDRHPTNPDILIAGEFGDGIHRTDDNGKTWRSLGLAGYMITDLRFDKTDGQRVYVCAQPYKGSLQGKQVELPAALFRSEDGGNTWQKLSDESPSEICQSNAEPNRFFGIFGAAEVFDSIDHGTTWTRRSDGLPTNGPNVGNYTSPFRYHALTTGPNFMLTGNGNGDLFRLEPGENAWTPILPKTVHNPPGWSHSSDRDGDFGHAMGFLLVDPTDAKHWVMTDWYAVWHTFDSGENWRPAVSGYEPTYIFHLIADASRPGLVHLAMSDNGYLRSEDGGKSFHRGAKGITSQIRDVDTSPANPDRVYAVGASSKSSGHWYVNQLFISDDTGKSWHAAPMTGLPELTSERFAASLSVDPADAQTLYLGVSGNVAAGDGGPYRSRDRGQTWQWIGEGLPVGKPLFRATFWGDGREIQTAVGDVVFCGGEKSKSLYRWDASAARWTEVKTFESSVESIAVDSTTPGRVLVGTGKSGVWITNDNGATWNQSYAGHAAQAAWDPRAPGRAMLATADMHDGPQVGLLMTDDGGEHWRWLEQTLPMRVGLRPAFVDGTLLVGTAGSGVFRYEAAAKTTTP